MRGMVRRKESTSLRVWRNQRLERFLERKRERAPTLGAMDISLSLSTTISFLRRWPARFRPSKASPAVMEPSPMTATTLWSFPSRSLAVAMPSEAEMDVEEWPTPKKS